MPSVCYRGKSPTARSPILLFPGIRQVGGFWQSLRWDWATLVEFILGFAGWFVTAGLVWGLLRLSHAQSSLGFLFFNPLALLVPVVNLLLIILYLRKRQMTRGALSASLVNSTGVFLMSPLSLGAAGNALLSTALMLPFFLLS